MAEKPTIAISHLGCEKNRIDSEHMLGLLAQAGYQVDSNEELADYIVVNTCSFIQAAREEIAEYKPLLKNINVYEEEIL